MVSTNKFSILFLKNKSGLSTILVLILLLFMSVFVFTMISNYFDFTLDNFKIDQQLDNFESKFEIINLDDNVITLQNDFSNNLKINSITIGTKKCILANNIIPFGISELDIGTCLENLELETIYSVIVETQHGVIFENEILSEIFSLFSYNLITPLNLASYSGSSINVVLDNHSFDNVSTWTNFDNTLVGYWNFDSGNSTHIYDLSGNSNDGTYVNGVVNNNSNNIRGNYSEFDGINDYIKIPISNNFNSSKEITISTWVKLNELHEGVFIYLGEDGSNFNFLQLTYSSATSRFGIRVKLSSDILNKHYNPVKNSVDTWHHITYTSSNEISGNKYFINGNLSSLIGGGTGDSSVITTPYNLTGMDSIILGVQKTASSGYYFNGSIDEVMIFNRSLSDDEIKSLYDSKLNNYNYNFTNLSSGLHTFQTCATNLSGDYNCLEQRNITLS